LAPVAEEDHNGAPPAHVLLRLCALMGGGCIQMPGRHLKTMGRGKAPISSWESHEQAGRRGDPACYLARAGRADKDAYGYVMKS